MIRKENAGISGIYLQLLFDVLSRHYATRCLTSSSHLQRQFKSPNSALNPHQRNEADVMDQIFLDKPAMDGGETSARIFVGQDSKITDVYKAKDNSRAKFLGAFQD